MTKILICNISSWSVLCPWGIKFLHNFYNGILLILPEQPSVDLHSVVCINLCVRILIDLFIPKTVGGVPAISKPIRAIWFVSFSELTANWRNISSRTDRYHAKWGKQLHVETLTLCSTKKINDFEIMRWQFWKLTEMT